jgi:hypothetical protein
MVNTQHEDRVESYLEDINNTLFEILEILKKERD